MEKTQPHFWAIPGVLRTQKINYKQLVDQRQEKCFQAVKKAIFEHFPLLNESHFHTESKTGKKRFGSTNDDALGRHLFFYLCKTIFFPTLSLKTIGNFVYKGFDHTSVIYGIKAVNDRLSNEKITREQLEKLERTIIIKLQRI